MRRVLAVLVLLTVGCGGSTEITTEGYDQSCEAPDDCLAVFVGDVCGCSCELDAINATQSTLWSQERSTKADRCDEVLNCTACPDVVVDCVENVCVASTAADTDS